MEDAASLHRDMLDAVQARDYGRFRDLLHADYTYLGGDGVEQKGADAGVAVVETYTGAFPDLVLEVRNHYSAGHDVSVLEFTAKGTHKEELDGIPATGRQVEVLVCDIIKTRDGKVVREREYFDGATMLKQLGVLPEE